MPNGKQEACYWITAPARLGYTNNLEHTYPVFVSREAAQDYGGPGGWPGEPDPEYEIVKLSGSELAGELKGAHIGARYIAIYGVAGGAADDEPQEVLTRRSFVKRLEQGGN